MDGLYMNKMDYKTGDILFSNWQPRLFKPRTWISAMIRLFTKSYWSHTAVIRLDHGKVFVFESTIGGGKLTPIELWLRGKNVLVYRPNESIHELYLIEYIGKVRYDYINTLIQQPFYQITGKWIGRKKEGDIFYNCSELISWVYNVSDSYKRTPAWLYRHREAAIPGIIINMIP